MDLDTLTRLGLIFGFLVQFAAVVWWAAHLTTQTRMLATEIAKIIATLDEHIETDREAHLELFRAVERLTALYEGAYSEHLKRSGRVVSIKDKST